MIKFWIFWCADGLHLSASMATVIDICYIDKHIDDQTRPHITTCYPLDTFTCAGWANPATANPARFDPLILGDALLSLLKQDVISKALLACCLDRVGVCFICICISPCNINLEAENKWAKNDFQDCRLPRLGSGGVFRVGATVLCGGA